MPESEVVSDQQGSVTTSPTAHATSEPMAGAFDGLFKPSQQDVVEDDVSKTSAVDPNQIQPTTTTDSVIPVESESTMTTDPLTPIELESTTTAIESEHMTASLLTPTLYSDKALWPSWLHSAITYLTEISEAPQWIALVTKLLILERGLDFPTNTVSAINYALNKMNY